jgi:hypothetical protein
MKAAMAAPKLIQAGAQKVPGLVGSALGRTAPAARTEAISGIQKGIGQGIEAQGVPSKAIPTTHEAIGEELKNTYTQAMQAAEANKAEVGKKLYGDMFAEAEQKAALGNTFKDSSGKSRSLQSAIEEMKDHQQIVTNAKGNFTRPQVEEAAAKASKLRSQINNYTKGFETPYSKVASEFGEAASATDVKGTALGRKFGTEGGIARDLYEKTSPEKLGSTVFRNSKTMEAYEDAIAGGKNATPAAREAAKQKVTNLLESHLKTSLAEQTPEQIAKHVAAPQNQAMYSYAPKVQSSIEAFGKQKMADEFRGDLNAYNKTFAGQNTKEAVQEGTKLLRSANNRGLISNDQYIQARSLVDRATTEEEKTASIRKVLGYLGLGFTSVEAAKHGLGY